jgi:hypothetical protein
MSKKLKLFTKPADISDEVWIGRLQTLRREVVDQLRRTGGRNGEINYSMRIEATIHAAKERSQ